MLHQIPRAGFLKYIPLVMLALLFVQVAAFAQSDTGSTSTADVCFKTFCQPLAFFEEGLIYARCHQVQGLISLSASLHLVTYVRKNRRPVTILLISPFLLFTNFLHCDNVLLMCFVYDLDRQFYAVW